MAVGPNLKVVGGGGGRNGEDPKPRGVVMAQEALISRFSSNATRSHLTPELVKQLDIISSRGTTLLAALEPYRHASVYGLELARRFSWTRSASPDLPEFIQSTLERTAKEFMGEHFTVFPTPESPITIINRPFARSHDF